MKTRKLWFAMAAAAILTGMATLVSCSEEENLLPEVIESEVYDEGIAEDVTAEVGTEGTTLSYESWIMVKGTTRASFDNRVSVTLNNQLKNNNGELDVTGWSEGDPVLEFSYKSGESKKDGFVTVTDSILVCTVKYPDFSFDYELVYQVAVYDDGATRQTMPYYRYENIRDKGGTFGSVESENGYEKRTLSHELEVDFNGETYTLRTELMLYKGRVEDVLLSSKVVNEGTEFANSTASSVTVKSFIDVEQEWSVKGKKTIRVEAELVTKMSRSFDEYNNVILSKWSMTDHLIHEQTVDSVKIGQKTVNNVEITTIRKTYHYAFSDEEAENGALFTLHVAYEYGIPVYKDAMLTYEMPYEKLTNPVYEFYYIGSRWEQVSATEWRHPFDVECYTWVGDPVYVTDGNDANGDGIDDITGEPVEWYYDGAVKLTWTYSCYLLWYQPER